MRSIAGRSPQRVGKRKGPIPPLGIEPLHQIDLVHVPGPNELPGPLNRSEIEIAGKRGEHRNVTVPDTARCQTLTGARHRPVSGTGCEQQLPELLAGLFPVQGCGAVVGDHEYRWVSRDRPGGWARFIWWGARQQLHGSRQAVAQQAHPAARHGVGTR